MQRKIVNRTKGETISKGRNQQNIGYAYIPSTNNVYKNPPKGGWVRIPQKDETFIFKWDEMVSSQEEVDKKYPNQNITSIKIGTNVIGIDGVNYKLSYKGRLFTIIKKKQNGELIDTPGKEIESNQILTKNYIPEEIGGTFNGEVNGCTFNDCDFNVKVDYSMANLTEAEKRNVRIIQVLYSDDPPHKMKNGKKLGSINGKLAFVDGGKNSAKKDRLSPWYGYGDNEQAGKFPGMKRNYKSDKFRFKLSDNPGAIGTGKIINGIFIPNYKSIHFESYIVIDNYQGSGKIKIISVVKWGFNNNQQQITKTIENPSMVPTNTFSKKAQEIWDNDYGDSEYKLF